MVGLVNRIKDTLFGYDATINSTKRKQRKVANGSEEAILTKTDRKKLVSNARDLTRNFSLAAWLIRKHLDYVASFSLQARTPDRALNDAIEKYIRTQAKPGNFDVTGRHSLNSYLRTMEARAVCDGDCGTLRLASGLVQGIEGDRIHNPDDVRELENNWTHGIRTDRYGRARAYCVWDRDPTGVRYDGFRIFGATNFALHGYFDRFDQVRGVSPLAPGINNLLDVYEGIGYSLAKLKVEQLFALAFYRNATESAGDVMPENTGTNPTEDEDPEDDTTGYQVDFGKGPVVLDLEEGDRAEFLKSDSPGANSREFLFAVLMLAIKSLDIPMSFFDESHTNFFGSRAAWLHYNTSCKNKRQRLQEWLEWWTLWKLQLAVISGDLVLPAGMTLDADLFEWIPIGMPWWDPVKEVNGEVLAIAAGLTTPQAVCKSRGTNYEDNIRAIADATRIAAENGVAVSFTPQLPQPTEQPQPENDDNADA